MKKSSEWKFPQINITMREVARQKQASGTLADKYNCVRGCVIKSGKSHPLLNTIMRDAARQNREIGNSG